MYSFFYFLLQNLIYNIVSKCQLIVVNVLVISFKTLITCIFYATEYISWLNVFGSALPGETFALCRRLPLTRQRIVLMWQWQPSRSVPE